MDLFAPTLVVHIGCGLTCVAIGWAPILTRKGSAAHRWAGRVFASVMAVMLAGAWALSAMHFSAYNIALSATATITVFSGYRVIRRKRPDIRAEDRATALDWIVTLAVVAIGVWTLTLLAGGRAGPNPAVSAALVYAAMQYGLWDIWRFARPADWPFSPDLWMYEHLAKMLSAYGAVLSAFSGNFLTFLPAPWSQLWPTVIFQPLAILWIACLILRRRARTPLIA